MAPHNKHFWCRGVESPLKGEFWSLQTFIGATFPVLLQASSGGFGPLHEVL